MKIAGMIGGIGPESTIEYYRLIVAMYRERLGDGSYPGIVITSIDLQRMLDLIAQHRLAEVTAYLADEVARLARAGASFAFVAANTPHVVFDDLRRIAPIPLISIVEATCNAARARGLRRVGLIGTRFTMQGSFYPDVFRGAGIPVIVPSDQEQAFIHDVYVTELINGIFRPEARSRLLAIIDRLGMEEAIDGVILGGTELPLILRDEMHNGIALLDTTRLHAGQLVGQLLP